MDDLSKRLSHSTTSSVNDSESEEVSDTSYIRSSNDMEKFIERAVTNPNSENEDSDSDEDSDNDSGSDSGGEGPKKGNKMSKLLALVGQYKHFLEIEKQEFERKMEQELEKSRQLEKENELLKEEFEQMVDEYEKRIEELNQEKIGRTKENLETLQTLVNELNYIEEKNQSLSDELDEEKKQNTTLRKELDLSKQLIKQLEMKVERQTQEVKQKMAVNETKFRSSMAQLDDSKEKMDKIVSLVTQLKELVVPEMSGVTGSVNSGGPNSLKMLWSEKEDHEKTKQRLADIQTQAKEDKAKIQKLEKRVQDLIKSQVHTIRRVKETGALDMLAAELDDNTTPITMEYAPISITTSESLKLDELEPTKESTPTTPSQEPVPIKNSYSGQFTLRVPFLSFPTNSQGQTLNLNTLRSTLRGTRSNANMQRRRTTLDFDRLSPEEKVQRMFLYVEMSKTDDLEALLQGNPFLLNGTDDNGRTALHKAVRNGNVPILNLLLSKGADYNKLDNDGWSVLHFAAVASADPTEIFKILLQKTDIRVNVPNNKKNLPIHLYVQSKFFNPQILEELIKRGPESLHYPNSEGDTPIFLACFDQHHEALTNILRFGALTTSTNAAGFLPLQIAARRGAVKCAETLISHGAEIRTYREQDAPKKLTKSLEKRKSSKSVLKKITVKAPEKKIKIHVDFSWKVSDVLAIIQEKIPGLVGHKLYLDAIELDPVHPLSNYPKLAETKELIYSDKNSKRKTFVDSARGSKIFGKGVSSPSEKKDGSSGRKSSNKIKRMSVAGLFVSPNSSSGSNSGSSLSLINITPYEKNVIIAQSVVRMHLQRKRYNILVKNMKQRRELFLTINEQAKRHVKILKKMNKTFVAPMVEYHSQKVGKEGVVLLACYERLIAVNEKLAKEMKPLLEIPYFKLNASAPFVHTVPSLRLYDNYGKQYHESSSLLQDKNFTTIVAGLAKKPEEITLFLSGLSAPMDYISFLKKSLTEFIRLTPNNHPDYQDMQKVVLALNMLKHI